MGRAVVTCSRQRPIPSFSEPEVTDLHSPLTTESAPLEPTGEQASSCALCALPLGGGEPRRVDGRPVCDPCALQLEEELRAERNQLHKLPAAILGGQIGALVGAGLWTALAVFANIEFGLVAVAVGFLAGFGAKLGAGKARGRPFQIATAICAALGLVAGKYFTFAHYVAEAWSAKGLSVTPFHPELIVQFFWVLPELLSPFDALWFFFALSSAWKALAESSVQVQ